MKYKYMVTTINMNAWSVAIYWHITIRTTICRVKYGNLPLKLDPIHGYVRVESSSSWKWERVFVIHLAKQQA